MNAGLDLGDDTAERLRPGRLGGEGCRPDRSRREDAQAKPCSNHSQKLHLPPQKGFELSLRVYR